MYNKSKANLSLVQVCAPIIENWLILRLHSENLLQLGLHAPGFGMIQANDLAASIRNI